MTGAELIAIGQRLFGKRGWQLKLAAALDIDPSTIRRWIAANYVPRIAVLAVQRLVHTKSNR